MDPLYIVFLCVQLVATINKPQQETETRTPVPPVNTATSATFPSPKAKSHT